MCMPVYISNGEFFLGGGGNGKFRMKCVEKYDASAKSFWIC